MTYQIGSARSDERGKYSGGKAGDQKQTSKNDYKGEVSFQDFYVHSKGWYVIVAKKKKHRKAIAKNMITACCNYNLGYSQSDRYGVIRCGVASTKPCNCDCSSLVRQCVKEATGKDPGDFNTSSEVAALSKTGLFDVSEYKSGMKLLTGSILVTKTKGHTVVVTSGEPEETKSTQKSEKYPKYTGKSGSIVEALAAVGESNTSYGYRKKIAAANDINNYTGTASQNNKLLLLLKAGKLIRC